MLNGEIPLEAIGRLRVSFCFLLPFCFHAHLILKDEFVK